MTVAFLLMTSNLLLQATIQCAVFEGRDRDVFIDRREEERMEQAKMRNAWVWD